MNLMGASNAFFYCFNHEYSTFEILFRLTFFTEPDLEKWKAAVNEALKCFPEFAVRPAISGNRVVLLPNDQPVAFFDSYEEVRHYGSEETNGYMFYFACEGRKVYFSVYHGLTDAAGINAFLKSALVLYAASVGQAVTEEAALEGVRVPSGQKVFASEMDQYDPYRLYGREDAVPEYQFERPGALYIPLNEYPDETNHVREYRVRVSTAAFIRRTKSLGVSFIPLIMNMGAHMAFKYYASGDAPFVSMVPVNLRPYFGSETSVNFSDGIFVMVPREDMELPIEERCRKIKEMMRAQMTRANFEKTIWNKTQTVEKYLADPSDLLSRQIPPAPGKGAYTFPFTYPGKQSYGRELDAMLEDVFIGTYSRVSSCIIHTYGDKMEFVFEMRNDDPSFVEHFMEELKEQGLDPVMEDAGHVHRDEFCLDEICRL